MSTETERAWLAGIFDGEGCIGLYAVSTIVRGKRYHFWRVMLSVTNTNLVLLDRVREIVGVGQVSSNGRRLSAKHRPAHRWQASAKLAVQVLVLIEPYLVAKREQCLLALTAQSLLGTAPRRLKNPHGARLEELRRRMATLNRKGPESIGCSKT